MANIVICAGITFSTAHMRPVGAFQLANVLRRAGYTVQIIDCWPWIANMGLEVVKRVLGHFVNEDTLWVGFSSTWLTKIKQPKSSIYAISSIYGDLDKLIENTYIFEPEELNDLKSYLQARSPNCKFVLGGGRAPLGRTGRVPQFIDCFIEGYADTTVLEWTRYCQGKNPFLPVTKNADGSISLTHDHKASSFDYNNHQFTWHDNDMVSQGEALPMEIARGCIFSCAFCAYPLNGRKKLDYLKDPIIIRRQLEENYERFGTTHYWFLDDTFNDSIDKLKILNQSVFSKLPFRINYSAFMRLDLINAHPESIDLLSEMGCGGISFGIESLNYESVKAIGKGISRDKIFNTLTKIKEKMPNAIIDSQFILGLPYETRETAENWLKEIEHPDYPLHNIKIHTLTMNTVSGYENIWSSHFEKNPEKYGYTFPTENKTYWVNNMNFSRKEAFEIIKMHQNFIDTKNGHGGEGWLGYAGIRNMGVSEETVKELYSMHRLYRIPRVNEIRRQFTSTYIQNLLKLDPQ